MKKSVFLLTLVLLLSRCFGALQIYDLKCDYQTDPVALDDSTPCLSWKLESAQRNQRQSAFQICVASSETKLKHGEYDLWDTGKVVSSQSIGISYHGAKLDSEKTAFWTVKVWDQDGREYDLRKTARWTMGLLNPSDWQAIWITRERGPDNDGKNPYADDPAPLFRKEFGMGKKVKRATVHVSGLGYYELYLNGKKIGDHVLDPGWTAYARRVLYSTFDVTDDLRRGQNAVGLMVGNGWYNPVPLRMWGSLNLREHLTVGEPRCCLQMRIEYADGKVETIGTDETWRVGDGPLLRNGVYLGEIYDARREQTGWNRPGFDDSSWKHVVRADVPVGPLKSQDAPPIRVTRILKPVEMTQPKPGVYIVDFGQNFSGWVRVGVTGAPGTKVVLRYGELLFPDGRLNGMTAAYGQVKGGGADYRYDDNGPPKTAFERDEYILKGGGQEFYCPRFTFHGFRYVEITGLSSPPDLKDIEGLRLNSDVAPTGEFSCSNEEFNRIQQMVLWTELSNMFSVESDCPTREKFGYGGDMVAASGAAIFNFDMERFYAKALQDLADSARPNGGFTETAPDVGLSDEGLGGGSGPVGWDTAQPFLQWELYQHYGDLDLLTAQYPATKRWMDFLESRAPEGILDNGISDHESLVPKPRALTGTAFYYLNAAIFAKIAHIVGKNEDAAAAEDLALKIKTAFNRKFLNSGNGAYDTGTQCCEAFALELGLVPDAEKDKTLNALVGDIVDNHQGHLTTGIFATRFMLHALTEAGRADVAYKIANQGTFPGWGYMLENGATTLWEHWTKDDNTYSHNHPMFGSVSEWFYEGLAGINAAPDSEGLDKIIINPQPVGDLKWVKASYNSVRGKVVSEWSREGDRFDLNIRIPVGATALVSVPARDLQSITESGKRLNDSSNFKIIGLESGRAKLEVRSGAYRFSSLLPR